jgi:hypothetical protein
LSFQYFFRLPYYEFATATFPQKVRMLPADCSDLAAGFSGISLNDSNKNISFKPFHSCNFIVSFRLLFNFIKINFT